MKAFLEGFLPSELSRSFGVQSFEWVDRLLGDDGLLVLAEEIYRHDVDELKEAAAKAFTNLAGVLMHLINGSEYIRGNVFLRILPGTIFFRNMGSLWIPLK